MSWFVLLQHERASLDSMVLLLIKLDQLDQEIQDALSATSSTDNSPTPQRRPLQVSACTLSSSITTVDCVTSVGSCSTSVIQLHGFWFMTSAGVSFNCVANHPKHVHLRTFICPGSKAQMWGKSTNVSYQVMKEESASRLYL